MNIVVYCSSADRLPADWQDAAAAVGDWIGSHGACLIYGGVRKGLMQIVAEATHNAGGQVVGVVPARRLSDAYELNDVKVPSNDLNDRKGIMQVLGDVYVVLPGGYGTLDEFAATFSYLNFTRQHRPIIVLNSDGIYDHIIRQYTRMAAVGLMAHSCLELITEVHSVAELTAALTRAVNNNDKK